MVKKISFFYWDSRDFKIENIFGSAAFILGWKFKEKRINGCGSKL